METKDDEMRAAFKSTHPGTVLKEWLEEVETKQKDFAAKIDVPASRLNELIKGKRPITPEMATKIASALGGVDAGYWMRLQAEYNYNETLLAQRAKGEKAADAQEKQLNEKFNLRELYKRLDIAYISPIQRTEKLSALFNGGYKEMVRRSDIAGCFKHSDTLRIDERNMRTWVLLAQYNTSQAKASGKYNTDEAEKAGKEIARLANKGTLREADIQEILSSHGILYVRVKTLPYCPIDAYSTTTGGVPAIVVTHRHDNMQKLIFDVLHEIGHIKLHMKEEGRKEFINAESGRSGQLEKEADAYARELLIPSATWEKIIKIQVRSARFDLICREIGEQAKSFGIDPCIAVARYKHDNKVYTGRTFSPTKIA